MGLFKNAAAEWEKTMTENDLDKWRRRDWM